MTNPKKDWRETDAGRFFQKNKVVILCCAAVGVAFAYAGGDESTDPGGGVVVQADNPIQSVDGGWVPQPGTTSGGVFNPVSDPSTGSGGTRTENWPGEKSQERIHKDRIETIREEQTCPNGIVISIHSDCPSE